MVHGTRMCVFLSFFLFFSCLVAQWWRGCGKGPPKKSRTPPWWVSGSEAKVVTGLNIVLKCCYSILELPLSETPQSAQNESRKSALIFFDILCKKFGMDGLYGVWMDVVKKNAIKQKNQGKQRAFTIYKGFFLLLKFII
jgi:hypothetical protein